MKVDFKRVVYADELIDHSSKNPSKALVNWSRIIMKTLQLALVCKCSILKLWRTLVTQTRMETKDCREPEFVPPQILDLKKLGEGMKEFLEHSQGR